MKHEGNQQLDWVCIEKVIPFNLLSTGFSSRMSSIAVFVCLKAKTSSKSRAAISVAPVIEDTEITNVPT